MGVEDVSVVVEGWRWSSVIRLSRWRMVQPVDASWDHCSTLIGHCRRLEELLLPHRPAVAKLPWWSLQDIPNSDWQNKPPLTPELLR